MICENWLVAVSIGMIAIAFVVLIIFVILALLAMRRMVMDIDQKVHSFDPLFRVVSKAGSVIERKAAKAKQFSEDVEPRGGSGINTAMEVAEWAMIGLALWQKIREKRER